MEHLKTIDWANDSARIIDQTCLPEELIYLDITTVEEMVEAIKVLRVRGAPAIGIAAAFGLYLAMRKYPSSGSVADFQTIFHKNADFLAQSRPTAVNLFWAIARVKKRISELPKDSSVDTLKTVLLNQAQAILNEDKQICRAIGENGFGLIKDCRSILTHCNAGGLAASEFGTALAPIYTAHDRGLTIRVYSDETRPLLQGSRITAFELSAAGIPVTVICDNMAPSLMRQKRVDAVIVGADRIAANGDTANKIGTYGVALSAKAHAIPMYIAAPVSTFDLSISSGADIPIEQRDSREVTCGFGRRTAPEGVEVYNPAFDVTPSELITAIITEKGVVYPPFSENIRKIIPFIE